MTTNQKIATVYVMTNDIATRAAAVEVLSALENAQRCDPAQARRVLQAFDNLSEADRAVAPKITLYHQTYDALVAATGEK